jgi:uncharacterized membrane protein
MDEYDGGLARTTSTAALDAEPTFEERQRQEEAAYGDTERLWEPAGTAERPAHELDGLRPLEEEPVPSVAQIAGHPLHPAIVPLPIGMFVGAFVADLAYARTRDRFWARTGHALALAGVGTGLLAGALGATDFVGRDRIRSRGSAWVHGAGNLAAVGLGVGSVLLRRDRRPEVVVPNGIALSTAIVAILAVTGWLGGELVFRHRVGLAEA